MNFGSKMILHRTFVKVFITLVLSLVVEASENEVLKQLSISVGKKFLKCQSVVCNVNFLLHYIDIYKQIRTFFFDAETIIITIFRLDSYHSV